MTVAEKIKTNTVKFLREKVKLTNKQISFLLCKGVFPYEYYDSLDKHKETSLPPREAFFSKLTGSGISEEEYQHAHRVWKACDCKSFKDYLGYYLLTDVLLLSDTFEEFRNMTMEHYGIDAAYVFTSPGMSFHAMLRKTGVEIGQIDNQELYMLIQNNIRGGISMIRKRHSKANNKYQKISKHDPSKPTTFITYLDANNLYGWAMS